MFFRTFAEMVDAMFFRTFAEKQIENKGRNYDCDTQKLRAEIKRLREGLENRIQCCTNLQMTNDKLRAALEEYACTGTDKPCGCFELLSKEKTEITRLRAALENALAALATTGENGCRMVLRKALASED